MSARPLYWDDERWTGHVDDSAPTQAQCASPSISTPPGPAQYPGAAYQAATRRYEPQTARHGVWVIVVSVVAFFVWLAILQSQGGSTY